MAILKPIRLVHIGLEAEEPPEEPDCVTCANVLTCQSSYLLIECQSCGSLTYARYVHKEGVGNLLKRCPGSYWRSWHVCDTGSPQKPIGMFQLDAHTHADVQCTSCCDRKYGGHPYSID